LLISLISLSFSSVFASFFNQIAPNSTALSINLVLVAISDITVFNKSIEPFFLEFFKNETKKL